MNKTMAVARREIAERSFVFVFAVALAVAPFLAMFAAGARDQKLEAVSILHVIVAVSFLFGLAGVTGISLIGREAREKRLSFYFARPLSAAQIWFGKVIGGIALLAGAAALVSAPRLLLPPLPVWTIDFPRQNAFVAGGAAIAAVLLFSAFLLMLAVHALGTMIRDRSPWIVFDLLGAGVATVLVVWCSASLAIHWAFGLASAVPAIAIVGAVVGVLAGGAAQLRRGGIALRAQHRALSVSLWSFVGVAVAAAGAITIWAHAVTVNDLERPIEAIGSPQFLEVSGVARHRPYYRAAFAIDPHTNDAIPLRQNLWLGSAFSPHGTALAWVDAGTRELLFASARNMSTSRGEVVVAKKLNGHLAVVRTGVEASLMADVAVSDDGEHVAVLEHSTLSLFDAAGKTVGAAHLQLERYSRVTLLDNGVVRVTTSTGPWSSRDPILTVTKIFDFDAGRREVRLVWTRSESAKHVLVVSSTDGATLVVFSLHPGAPSLDDFGKVSVVDLMTRGEVALNTAGSIRPGSVTILRDGRIVAVALSPKNAAQLTVFDRTGRLLAAWPLPDAMRLCGEATPGTVVLTPSFGRNGKTLVVNVTTGRGMRTIDGRVIQGYLRGVFQHEEERIIGSGQSLALWNAATGATRKLM